MSDRILLSDGDKVAWPPYKRLTRCPKCHFGHVTTTHADYFSNQLCGLPLQGMKRECAQCRHVWWQTPLDRKPVTNQELTDATQINWRRHLKYFPSMSPSPHLDDWDPNDLDQPIPKRPELLSIPIPPMLPCEPVVPRRPHWFWGN